MYKKMQKENEMGRWTKNPQMKMDGLCGGCNHGFLFYTEYWVEYMEFEKNDWFHYSF